jgi:hypothetical protein
MPNPDWRALREAFRRDGVVFLKGALDADDMRLCRAAFDWTRAHPGPGASEFYADQPGKLYQDLANPGALPAYRKVLTESSVADIVGRLWGMDEVWFFYEQIFVREGAAVRRTPWHQDSPYLPIEGETLAVMWITFEPVTKDDALEFIPGSHRGTLYNGSAFDPADDTRPIYPGGVLPTLPDIEADRAAWPIVSWAVEPGDVIVFHPGVLHGGSATKEGRDRHTLSLRFFGADATFALRPSFAQNMPDYSFARAGQKLKPGEPFRNHPAYPKLRPLAEAYRGIAAE